MPINTRLMISCCFVLVLFACPVFPSAPDPISHLKFILNASSSPQTEPSTSGITLFDAIKATVSRQPNIDIYNSQVDIQIGQWNTQSGNFDLILDSSIEHTHNERMLGPLELQPGITKEKSDITTYSLGLNKKYRNGIEVRTVLQIDQSDPSYAAVDPTEGIPPTNQSRIEMLLSIPLIRNRGKNASGAMEMEAEKNYHISLLKLRHSASQSIYETIVSYWNYTAAFQSFLQHIESEKRAQALMKDTQKLIEADERPAAELDQMKANLADKSRDRISSEQDLFESGQDLGLSMGLSFEEIISLPYPRTAFPLAIKSDIERITAASDDLINLSLLRRNDYKASLEKINASMLLVNAAKNNLLPLLNLNLGLGYNGLTEGSEFSDYFSSVRENHPGANYSLSINTQWPIANNRARGLAMQQNAILRKNKHISQDLSRQIKSGVTKALTRLRSSYLELEKTRESIITYRTALENEKRKFKIGLATIRDLTAMEDRLTRALIGEIFTRAKFCKAIALLRFETSSLFEEENGHIILNNNTFTTLPEINKIP